jgi:DNA modification methylase
MDKKNKRGEDKVELFTDSGESRGFYSRKNRLNDLTGKEWVYWSKSVINKPYPPDRQHRLRSRHGGQKPPELCADLIRVFTKKGQLVLDPFAGVGGTLLGASLAGRRAVGIELNPDWIEIYHEVCRREAIPEQRLLDGDSREKLLALGEEGLVSDFILTDVPFWHMDRVERSRGKYKRVGEEMRDAARSKLSSFNEKTYPDKEAWLDELEAVFRLALPLLKEKGYLAVFIGDMYNRGEYHFLSADLARLLTSLGLTMKSNLIWYDVSKSLHIYGYLYDYIPSMIHQSILVFRRERA